jgi:hypothetical protein
MQRGFKRNLLPLKKHISHMSEFDNDFNEWKDDTRTEALEKEIERLRLQNKNQSLKIQNLRKALYFQLFFVISLFAILLIKGFISLPGSLETKENVPATTIIVSDTTHANYPTQTIIKYDTLYMMGMPDKFDQKKAIFSVQIGAFAAKDLKQFESNMTKNMHQETFGPINQISIGLFSQYIEAEAFLKIVKEMGFKDAFIMALKNGQRISLQEAITSIPQTVKTTQITPVISPVTSNTKTSINDSVTQPKPVKGPFKPKAEVVEADTTTQDY